jgi:hypothetical protein
MTRKHSTRLSQEHDEDPEEQRRTASADYPELGDILTSRPDPGRQITVIGTRRTAEAYDAEHDARNGDYNGGEGDTGMYWAEPGEQAWARDHLGPQEEAPPPLMEQSPVLARLAAIEEAQQFFGLRHHATTINGTHVDDAGDAPQHGTVSRAEDPNSYDDRSTEGQGDNRWNQALPDGDKKAENAATVGMYPEGMSAGGGPGLEIGAFTAHLDEEWNTRYPDLTHVHGQMVTAPQLAAHLRQDHGFNFPPGTPYTRMRGVHTLHHIENFDHPDPDPAHWSPEYEESQDYDPPSRPAPVATDYSGDDPVPGSATYHAHEGPIDPVFGARHGDGWDELRSHMIAEHGTSDPYARHANPYELDEHHAWQHENQPQDHDHYVGYGPPEHVSPLEDWAWDQGGGDASGYHEFTGSRKTARVPWTGKERGNLHSWHNVPTATWGDFVNSADFPMLGPGESVHHVEPGEPLREAESAIDLPHPHDDGNEIDQGGVEGDDGFPRIHRDAAFNVHVRIDGKELHDHDDDGPEPQPQRHEHDDPDNSLDNPPDKNSPEITSGQASGGGLPDSPPVTPPDGRTNPDDPGLSPDDPGHPDNWPQAGADVSETGRAYTQGSDDGKVKRGAPAPGPFSPGDGDSGGGGDQGDDPDDGDRPDDEGTPFSKDGALAMFTAAAGNPAFRFEFTAAWHDVVAKAKRIRAEGHVRITHASAGMVIGEVRGDHDTYESGIQRPVGKRMTIQHWACGCPWASFHQDKAAATRYAGRPCSHVMALQFEAQSRGMFGRQFNSDAEAPSWSPQTVVVKSYPPYEGDPHAGQWREQWRAPLAHRVAHREGQEGWPYVPPVAPRDLAQHIIGHHGLDAGNVARALTRMGDPEKGGIWARTWHNAEHRNRTEHAFNHQHDAPSGLPGEARWPAAFQPEHGFTVDQYGGVPHRQFPGAEPSAPLEPMRPHWSSLAPADRATVALLRSGADPGTVGALRVMAGMRATADQANSSWGSQNVSEHPTQKPYGATSPRNWDMDPGSYGPLSGPDPDNWGGIQDNSATQMPLTNTAAHQVLVPGAPRPVPGDLHWPAVEGWQQEDQGSFGYTDRANTAGPSTAMNARDPNGIRMEEARHSMRWFVPSYGTDSHAHAVGHALRESAEQNRDHLLVPFVHQDDEFPKIAVTSDYSLGNNRGHFRVSPEGQWSRYNPDEGYSPWREPRHEDVFTQAHVNRLRDTAPPGAVPADFDFSGRGHYTAPPEGTPIDPVFGALASGTPYPFRDTVPQLDGALAELRDHPEPALPETTGDDIEATAAADGTIGGGDAGTGSGQGAPLDTAALGEFGAARRMYLHHLAGTPMGDLGRETSPQAQQPSPVGQEPGMGSGDEYLTPDDSSIQTMGNQQWSGGGADSDETAVPAGQPQGGIDDIVAAFHRSAAAKGYAGDSRPVAADGDIAGAARAYLSKTADVLPQAEAEELIREGAGSRARNLDLLRLEGTHYEEADEDLGKRGVSLDDYDDDVMFA